MAGGRIGGVVTALIVAVCVVMLAALGVWQVKRLHWKEDYLRRVAAAQHGPARPLATVLAEAARGADVEYDRVVVDCQIGPPQTLFVWDVQGDRHGWRALAACRTQADGLVAIDRGFVTVPGGRLEAPSMDLAPIGRAIGQLRRPSGAGAFDQPGSAARGFHSRAAAITELARRIPGRYAPLLVVVEREDPAPANVTPAPLPTNIPNNHLGYALTWFGLALALVGVYAGALIKRRRRS